MTNNEIRQGDTMTDTSQTAHARSERRDRIDAPTMSEADVEIVVPDHYRLSREANRALIHVIMAVRHRILGSERGIA